MKVATLMFPTRDNAGECLAAMHGDLKRQLCRIAGGFTASPAEGGWLGADGSIQIEPVTAYRVAYRDAATLATLRQTLVAFGRAASQEAVMLETPDGAEIISIEDAGAVPSIVHLAR